ncbi:MAG: sporulation transcriptional regulator SpoIIID [Christensenellales bacterium]
MYNSLDDRAICLAKYIISTKATVRKTAKVFGISKSTVHNDITKKLKNLSLELYFEVHSILMENFAVKHLRGGEATRLKYKNMEKAKKCEGETK